jgi:hypothetical protein
MKEFEEALRKAIIKTINEMGMSEFKKLSWFMSNRKDNY